MPTIGEMEYGYSSAGVRNYIEDVRAVALTDVVSAARDIDELTRVIDANWQGFAKERYKQNLKADIEVFATAMEQLYTVFQKEIKNIETSMKRFDNTMFREGGV